MAYALLFLVAYSLFGYNSDFAFGCYTSIFSFGGSVSDTGNYVPVCTRGLFPCGGSPNCSIPPYGETFFHRPTGRCSDGRLIIDFIAEHYGLPLLPPYSGGDGENINFDGGVNFAIVGSPSLDETLEGARANISMTAQINWFKNLLPTICKTSNCDEFLRRSLIVFGPFGNNDYGPPVLNKTVEDAYRLQPKVVNAIGSAIEGLIELGVVNVMVPGLLTDGCLGSPLSYFAGSNEEDYDQIGCLTWLNELSQSHNELLQKELSRIRQRHPNVSIIYADLFNAAYQLFLFPEKYGFNKRRPLDACCGCGGPYNFDLILGCGYPSTQLCVDPSAYILWDGVHLTEAAHRWITSSLFNEFYANPNIINASNCSILPNGNTVYTY